jgi:hypothetical protein
LKHLPETVAKVDLGFLKDRTPSANSIRREQGPVTASRAVSKKDVFESRAFQTSEFEQ